MNKKIIIVGIILITLISLIFLSTGSKRTDVYLEDYEIKNNGNTLSIKVGVSSSTGYIRKMKQTSGSMNYYLTFYSTFGINSKLGAKDTYDLHIDSNVDEIYFYIGNKGYTKVLEKDDATGEWIKVIENNEYKDYEKTSTLSSNKISTEVLVRFDGTLYGQSYKVIDYAGNTETIGTIDKVINNEYVPKYDNETNQLEILNAQVVEKTDNTIVILFNNEYVLFEKIK